LLYRQHRWAEAVAELDRIEPGDGSEDSQRSLRAAALGRLGAYQEAIGLTARSWRAAPARRRSG
jgi:hypothetical protein